MIHGNYLSDPRDVAALLEGLRLSRAPRLLMRKALRAREKGVPWMVILSLWTEVIFPKRKPITSTAGNAIAWILLVPVVLIALAGAMALFMQK